MKLKNRFQRKEKKYLLDTKQYLFLKEEFLKHMTLDQYGRHTIMSLYYDDQDFTLIRRSIKKPKYKEKFRVRSYGLAHEESVVYLEIKKKVKGVVYKRRVGIPYNKWATFNQHPRKVQVKKEEQQVKKEVDYLVERMHLFPQVLISYDREAYFGKIDSDFRVTFDHNIRFRTEDLVLDKGSEGKLVSPDIPVLMEVKALGAYPLWFCELLSRGNIYPGSFSKYAYVYEHHLLNEKIKEEQFYAS